MAVYFFFSHSVILFIFYDFRRRRSFSPDPSTYSSTSPSPVSSESSFGGPAISPATSSGPHLRRSKRLLSASGGRASEEEEEEEEETGFSVSREHSPSLLEYPIPRVVKEITPVPCSNSCAGSHDESCDLQEGTSTRENSGTVSDLPSSPVISEDETETNESVEEQTAPVNTDLSISTGEDEFFSAQEDSERGDARSPDGRKRRGLYTANTGGSICCDDGEDMIAGTVTLGTVPFETGEEEEEEEDNYFIGQASPSESDIQQMVSSSQKSKISVGASLSCVIGDVSRSSKLSEVKLEKKVPESCADTTSSTTISEATPTTSQPVLGKMLHVVVPKLLHRNLSHELKKLKSSPLPSPDRSSPVEEDVAPSPRKKGYIRKSPAKRLRRSSNSEQGTVAEVKGQRMKQEQDLSGSEEDSNQIAAHTEGLSRKTRGKRKGHTAKTEFKLEVYDSEEALQDNNALQDSDVIQDGDSEALRDNDSVVLQDSKDSDGDALQDSDGEAIQDSDGEALQDSHGEGALQNSYDSDDEEAQDSNAFQDSGGKGAPQDSGGKGALQDDNHGDSSTPTSKHPSLSSDDITFSDLDNLVNSPASIQSSNVKRSHFSSSRKTSTFSVKSTNLTPRQSSHWGSDDDDFDMTLSQPPSSQLHLSNSKHSSWRSKKKKTLRKVSSDEDEKPFPSSKGKKGLRLRLRSFVKKEKLPHEAGESRKEEKAAKKRLDFGGSFGLSDGSDEGGQDEEGAGGEGVSGDVGVGPSHDETDGEAHHEDVTEMGGADDVTEKGGTPDDVTVKAEGKGLKLASSVKQNGDALSSQGETTPTLKVNIELSKSSLMKLGKHIKGEHGKGKEKAPRRPDLVMCCACGIQVNWKKLKLHAHPRLNVVICQVRWWML